MDIRQNYFELLSQPEQYQLDSNSLLEQFRALQKEFHPDRFSNAMASEQRIALQYSSLINEAFQTLSSPFARAKYLLQLKGFERNEAQTMSSDPEFLMQQIQWREALAEVSEQQNPELALENIADTIDKKIKQMQQLFNDAYNDAQYDQALETVCKMQFLFKLITEVEQLEEQLLE